MNPDFPARVFSLVAAALFILAQAAAGLTIDLDETQDSRPISLTVSRTDTNRIELPETIINAFSSNESMDVKIIGRSALVRTENPAELIILTEKRRLTLLLAPEDVPSRTLIITARKASPAGSGHQAGSAGDMEPLPYEKIITDLVVSLASGLAPAEKIPGERRELADSLFLAHLRDAASPPFFASLYVVRNAGSRSAALTESMFSADPGTVAVGIDRNELLPGESSQVFIVTKKEPSR